MTGAHPRFSRAIQRPGLTFGGPSGLGASRPFRIIIPPLRTLVIVESGVASAFAVSLVVVDDPELQPAASAAASISGRKPAIRLMHFSRMRSRERDFASETNGTWSGAALQVRRQGGL